MYLCMLMPFCCEESPLDVREWVQDGGEDMGTGSCSSHFKQVVLEKIVLM